MPVRLFVGNLPFGATEADLRSHFSALAPPVSILMPVNRETGRPRGFAFVDFVDRGTAEEAIRRFNGQSFQGRPLAVSEARAREDRPPGGFSPRPPGGGFSPRPPSGHYGGPPRFTEPLSAPPQGRERMFRNEPKRAKNSPAGRKGAKQESGGPRGPIPERHTGRVFDVDEYGVTDEGGDIDFDNFATSAKEPYTPPEDEEK